MLEKVLGPSGGKCMLKSKSSSISDEKCKPFADKDPGQVPPKLFNHLLNLLIN